MKLKPRLEAVASFVPPGSVAADIGTDHGYLPIYLVMNNTCSRVIAVDCSQGPLSRAAEAIRLFNLRHKIELRYGNGLEAITMDDEVEILIIAGMGGRSICRLLIRGKEKLPLFKRLIIQPMTESPLVRRWLLAHRLRFTAEKLVSEGSHIYEIIVAEPGVPRTADHRSLEIGPKLLESGDPLLRSFLEKKISRYQRIIDGLRRSGDLQDRRREYYEKKRADLMEVLDCVCSGSDDH